MIRKINSKTNTRIKHAASLKEKKYREEFHEFLIEGDKVLKMALEAKMVKEIFTISPLLDVSDDIIQYVISRELLVKITNTKSPQGVAAICSIPNYSFKDEYKKVVYLDDIADPGNLGTIIRTALSFGYDAIIASENTVDFFNPKVVASSKGSIFFIPVLAGKIVDFKEKYQIIVSSLNDKSIPLEEAKTKIKDRMVLVIGNEANGVKEETASLADLLVKIPMVKMDSLNAAVASGILMYTLK